MALLAAVMSYLIISQLSAALAFGGLVGNKFEKELKKLEKSIDACFANPCQNEASIMIHKSTHYECHCQAGWHGPHCDKPDVCSQKNPCQNKASLVTDEFGNHTCSCKAGWTGAHCETRTTSTCNGSSPMIFSDFIEMNSEVHAVATLGHQLFVTRSESNRVEAYNLLTLSPNPTWHVTIPGNEHYGLAINPAENTLYVSDHSNESVYQVNVTSQSVTANWKLSLSYQPNGLSLNNASNLLVAGYGGWIEEWQIMSNGSFVNIRTRHCEGAGPWQAVELPGGSLAVSRCTSVDDVSLMNKNNDTLLTTPINSGLRNPSALAVDTQGYTIVADFGNDRIVVVNPQFNQTRELDLNLLLHGIEPIYSPWGLWFDKSNCRLYVGESNVANHQNRVLIFDNVVPSALFTKQ